jgi:hypothetical protein
MKAIYYIFFWIVIARAGLRNLELSNMNFKVLKKIQKKVLRLKLID